MPDPVDLLNRSGIAQAFHRLLEFLRVGFVVLDNRFVSGGIDPDRLNARNGLKRFFEMSCVGGVAEFRDFEVSGFHSELKRRVRPAARSI